MESEKTLSWNLETFLKPSEPEVRLKALNSKTVKEQLQSIWLNNGFSQTACNQFWNEKYGYYLTEGWTIEEVLLYYFNRNVHDVLVLNKTLKFSS